MSEKDNPLTEAFFYILLSLRHPNHGYGVIQEVEELTKGRVSLGGRVRSTERCRPCRSAGGSAW